MTAHVRPEEAMTISKRGKRGACSGPGPTAGGRGGRPDARPITYGEVCKDQGAGKLHYEDNSGSGKGLNDAAKSQNRGSKVMS